METVSSAIAVPTPLPARAHMLKHRIHVGFQIIENSRHMDEALFDHIQPGQHDVAACGNGLLRWHRTAIEYRIKMLRVPAKRHRQRFQSARTTPTLNSVPLDFPDNGWRYMGTHCKFALTP